MGGIGSGRHKWASKLRVEIHALALRVGELRRWGALRDGAWGTFPWDDPEQPLGAINFRSAGTRLVISYRIGIGADARSFTEEIFLARVRAGFGGMRNYFRCPDPDCNRRVEALHFAKGRFRCRRCHGLVYEPQYEDADHRAYRRANKLRARLRYEAWRPFILAPIVVPKRMWRRKFWRLQDAIDEADCIASMTCAARSEALADRRAGLKNLNRGISGVSA